jgi:septation ring formation regulator EzrA
MRGSELLKWFTDLPMSGSDAWFWGFATGLMLVSLAVLMVAFFISLRRKRHTSTINQPEEASDGLNFRLYEVKASIAQAQEAHDHHQDSATRLKNTLSQWTKEHESTPPSLTLARLIETASQQARHIQREIEGLYRHGLVAHTESLNASESPQVLRPQAVSDWLQTLETLSDQTASLCRSLEALSDHHDRPSRAQHDGQLAELTRWHRELSGLTQSIGEARDALSHVETLLNGR